MVSAPGGAAPAAGGRRGARRVEFTAETLPNFISGAKRELRSVHDPLLGITFVAFFFVEVSEMHVFKRFWHVLTVKVGRTAATGRT